MELIVLAVVATTAAIASFCAGLMGIGGGIIMAPLLFLAHKVFPVPEFPVKAVAGLAVAQDLVGSIVAALTHRRYEFVDREVVFHMGAWIGASALVGGLVSHYASGVHIFGVLAIFVSLAALAMVFTAGTKELPEEEPSRFPKGKAAAVSIPIGLMAGFIGQGSAFILIPAMLLVLRLPVRVTISSALGIVFCASLGGFVGKWGTNQVSMVWLLPLLVIAVPSAYLGAHVSHRVSDRVVRALLMLLLIVVAIEMWRIVLSEASS